MTSSAALATIVTAAYLAGSIPAGYLVGRARGIDVRREGSGNIGATNVGRLLGRKYGYGVFLFDATKGLAAVRLAYWIASATEQAQLEPEVYGIIAAVMAVVGHSFPIWLRFRGGKGVAASVGGMLGLMPLAALIILIVWGIVFELTRYVSVASLSAAVALPLVVILVTQITHRSGLVLFVFSLAIAGLVLWRHRSNISRLIAGTEPRFARK
jgi:glycerol-3-phosphate acyltransferase PlsY